MLTTTTVAPSATRSRHETTPATIVASLAIGLSLLLAHASIELSPAASTVAALLHLDEPGAHVLLGDGSSNDKTDGRCLDTGTTHHTTG
jgi:hypothetical protein